MVSWYALPTLQEQTALSITFVGIDIANCSATREEKRRAGQEEDKTWSHSPATEFRGGQSVCPGLVSAARGQEKDKRTRPGHRVEGRGQSVWPAQLSILR